MLQSNPNLLLSTIITTARLLYGVWSWIKPSLVLPSHAINHTRQNILIISKRLIILTSLLIPLDLALVTRNSSLTPTPIVFVVDQSRSMQADDLTPSRRAITQTVVQQLQSLPNQQQLMSYAQTPQLNSGTNAISKLQPISTQAGSSALGDARLIAYDQIASGIDYKPIIITITDGGSNTGYDLSQTATILKTRAQLWIVGISTGTRIVAYDDSGRGLTSTMDAALLSSLADSGHRYPIPDDTSLSGIVDQLTQDLSSQNYRLPPVVFSFQPILRVILGLGIIGRGSVYLTKKTTYDL